MKSSPSTKSSISNSFNTKSKKGSKDREKRKSQNSVDLRAKDKNSPSKDNKQYAGISADFISSINIYEEYLSDDVRETLAEDINYRLRHIIHDALIKARLSGRNVIYHNDIDETFKNLSIENVYGATSSPNWVPLAEHNILYLDDAKLNLIELAEEENNYAQHGDIVLTTCWIPDVELDNASHLLKNYFMRSCYALINSDDYVRNEALKDISENSNIGPIIDWFYNFAYFLLLKDITYDCLTLNALNLIETLENSLIGSQNASDKQLNLLIRLLLQRLIFSKTNKNIIKPMCSTLALLCLRYPLRKITVTKLNHKLAGIPKTNLLPIVTVIYFLGIEAVQQIFIPNIDYFLECVSDLECPDMKYMTLAIYGLLCKASCDDMFVQHRVYAKFGYTLLPLWKQLNFKEKAKDSEPEGNFCVMKIQLLKTRRQLMFPSTQSNQASTIMGIENVFELPPNNCIVGKKLEEHKRVFCNYRKQTHAVVGKTNILLSVMRRNKHKILGKCYGHTLSFNI